MCSCCDDETAVNCEFLRDIIQQNCDECDPDNTVPNGCHINACSKYCGGGTKTRTRQVTPDNNNIEELMFIKIKLCDGGIETRTRTVNDYTFNELPFDNNGNDNIIEYYVFISTKSFQRVDDTISADYDININNGKSLISLLRNSRIPNHIGNRFTIDLNIININDDVSVILTIDSQCKLEFVMYGQYYKDVNNQNNRGIMHHIIIQPQCYRCAICGLCGDFKHTGGE